VKRRVRDLPQRALRATVEHLMVSRVSHHTSRSFRIKLAEIGADIVE